MSIFRSLIDLIRPRPQPTDSNDRPIPFPILDLTPGQVEQLRDLRKLPEWDTYLLALDRQTTLYGEGLLTTRDPHDMARAQGTVLGLREAALFVDRIILDAEERKKEDERRRSNEFDREQHKRAVHFASPAWSMDQRSTH